jgi:hypothetical protein
MAPPTAEARVTTRSYDRRKPARDGALQAAHSGLGLQPRNASDLLRR